jgi:hypothetical protein
MVDEIAGFNVLCQSRLNGGDINPTFQREPLPDAGPFLHLLCQHLFRDAQFGGCIQQNLTPHTRRIKSSRYTLGKRLSPAHRTSGSVMIGISYLRDHRSKRFPRWLPERAQQAIAAEFVDLADSPAPNWNDGLLNGRHNQNEDDIKLHPLGGDLNYLLAWQEYL